LEAELEAEQRRLRETAANMRKYERQYKEIVTQAEDDRRQVAELTSLVDQLTIKIKTYKRQIEEAVSINKNRQSVTPIIISLITVQES
jgi:myosin heavy chain 6/7